MSYDLCVFRGKSEGLRRAAGTAEAARRADRSACAALARRRIELHDHCDAFVWGGDAAGIAQVYGFALDALRE